jgi:hypothetical protein
MLCAKFIFFNCGTLKEGTYNLNSNIQNHVDNKYCLIFCDPNFIIKVIYKEQAVINHANK